MDKRYVSLQLIKEQGVKIGNTLNNVPYINTRINNIAQD